MNPKLGQAILIFINVLAIPAVGYAIFDFFSVKSAVSKSALQIPFDSGLYYFLLLSVFWIFSFIQIVGLRGGKAEAPKYASALGIGWFVAMLALANATPFYLESELERAGYVKCDNPAEISRVSRGESSIYVKGNCPNSQDSSLAPRMTTQPVYEYIL